MLKKLQLDLSVLRFASWNIWIHITMLKFCFAWQIYVSFELHQCCETALLNMLWDLGAVFVPFNCQFLCWAICIFAFVCCGMFSPKGVSKSWNWYIATWPCCSYCPGYCVLSKHNVSPLHCFIGFIDLSHHAFCHCCICYFWFWSFHFLCGNCCGNLGFYHSSRNDFQCNFDLAHLFFYHLGYIEVFCLFKKICISCFTCLQRGISLVVEGLFGILSYFELVWGSLLFILLDLFQFCKMLCEMYLDLFCLHHLYVYCFHFSMSYVLA